MNAFFNRLLRLSIGCIILFYSMVSNAQLFLPAQVISKYKDGEMWVRWEPSSMEEWHSSKKNGYKVEIIEISGTGLKSIPITKMIVPLTYEKWDGAAAKVSYFKSQFYLGCKNFLYPEGITDEEQKLSSAFRDESKASLDSLTLGLMVYAATYDMNLAIHTGLATKFAAKQGSQYLVRISTTGFTTFEKQCFAVDIESKIPTLSGTWGDKEVELKWNTLEQKKDYFGYVVERSEDGFNFVINDSIPNVNTTDKYAKSNPENAIYTRKDSLALNYKQYYFRIKGFDFFGDISTKFSSITGYGFDKITLSPLLIYADQTEENEAHLKWQVSDKEAYLVQSFSILRADSLSGEYTKVVDSIPGVMREYKHKMNQSINYFRIEANPKDGKPLSSMPVLVMGQDTIPPKKPEIISAVIDSLGRAVITWTQNKEKDLWGYRIYKSNFREDEFSLINSYPIRDSFLIDSIDIDLGTKEIFYFVEAADKRNNRSSISDTVELTLPDMLAPESPIVIKLETKYDSVLVYFSKSTSEDVKTYTLYRREVDQQKSWVKVIELPNTWDEELAYIDTKLIFDKNYAYTITAKDSTGNESIPQHYQSVYLEKPKKEIQPLAKIEMTKDQKKNEVTISWAPNSEVNLKSVLIYKGNSKDRMSKYKYVDSPDLSITEAMSVKEEEVVYYRLKPVFEGQGKAYFSDYIEVKNDKVEAKK